MFQPGFFFYVAVVYGIISILTENGKQKTVNRYRLIISLNFTLCLLLTSTLVPSFK
jgi:hypothetical protein